MDRADVDELVDAVASIAASCRDRSALTAAVAASSRLRAWLDGRDVLFAGCLSEVASFPEQAVAEAGRTSLRDASRVVERARTVESLPAVAQALDDGAVSAGHVDVIGRTWRALQPSQRQQLERRDDWLAEVAAGATPQELQRVMRRELRRIQADDGMARLERQRGATRLRSWVDREGMWCLSGRFDPQTGLQLHGRLTAAMAELPRDELSQIAPADPAERQDWLRAQALVALTSGTGGPGGRPEIVVVVDATAADPGGGPAIDWGLPVELPARVLRDLYDAADTYAVVVRNGVVLHAPGLLDLGRSTRLASRAQRRALRALYPTCAVPGCDVRFELCRLHHVVWWEHGGGTDLHNLLPLCSRHHHAVHDRRWRLALTADRQLTITYPDGRRDVTRPPPRWSAPARSRPP